jgi:hypothetical protein
VFEIKEREGRALTPQEWSRTFALVEAIDQIDNIFRRRAERQRRIAKQPSVIAARPRRPVRRALLPRRARTRRASAPLVARTRTRRGAGTRASPKKAAGDPDPAPTPTSEPPDPALAPGAEGALEGILADHEPPWIVPPAATAIARLAGTDTELWGLLAPRDRREIIARINFGLSRADSQWIAELLQQASHRDGWHWPIVGQLWLTDQVPTGGCLVRYCDPRTGRNRGPWCVLYVTASFAARLPPEGSA